MFKETRKWLIVLIAGSMLYSCAPSKQAAYFRTFKETEDINRPDKVYYIDDDITERIQIGDELYIRVSSGNDEPNSFSQAGGGGGGGTNVDLVSYKVELDGTIKLPYVNYVKVVGMSLNEAVDSLESELSQYLYLPSVTIHFVNSRISILGDVNSPGVYIFNRKSVNIYEAIAFAGDVALFGNRKNVLIIRQEGNSVSKKHVDLTNDEIITSIWYNIKPNDIIYVEPMSRKNWGIVTFPYGLVFSLLSTTLVLITYFGTPRI